MAISVVQTVHSNTATTTIAATGGSGSNTLIVCVNSFKSSGAPSITSVTLGGTALTLAVDKIFSSSGENATWIYYLSGIATGQTSVAVSGTNLGLTSGNGGVCIYEVSGLATSLALDKTNSSDGTTQAWSSGATGTLSNAAEIVIGNGLVFQATNPSGFTNTTDSGAGWIAGYQIVSSTTSVTYGASQVSADPWVAVVASFTAPTGTNVSISPATVSIAANTLTIPSSVSISPAALGVAVNPFTIPASVNINPAVISIAVNPFTIEYGPSLNPAVISVVTQSFTPLVNTPLSPATLSVSASSIKATASVSAISLSTVAAYLGTTQYAIPGIASGNLAASHLGPATIKIPGPASQINSQAIFGHVSIPVSVSGLTASMTIQSFEGSAKISVPGNQSQNNIQAYSGSFAVGIPGPEASLSVISHAETTISVTAPDADTAIYGELGRLIIGRNIRGNTATDSVSPYSGTVNLSVSGHSNISVASEVSIHTAISGSASPDSILANLGVPDISVSEHASSTVITHTGSPKISPVGEISESVVLTPYGIVIVSPRGSASGVISESYAFTGISVNPGESLDEVLATIGAVNLSVSPQQAEIIARAYFEGKAVQGITARSSVEAHSGEISASISVTGLISAEAHLGIAGAANIIANIYPSIYRGHILPGSSGRVQKTWDGIAYSK